MKPFFALFLSALLLVPALFAQQAATTEPTDVPLIPEEVPQTEKPRGQALDQSGGGGGKKSKTDINNEELKDRIHYREAKTKALRDPKVQAQWERSVQAKTDAEKRDALKSFYKLLYARMTQLDGSLKKLIDLRQQSFARRLEQTRVDPTVPLDPDEGTGRASN